MIRHAHKREYITAVMCDRCTGGIQNSILTPEWDDGVFLHMIQHGHGWVLLDQPIIVDLNPWQAESMQHFCQHCWAKTAKQLLGVP